MKLTRRGFLLGTSAIVIGAVGLNVFTPKPIATTLQLEPLPPGEYVGIITDVIVKNRDGLTVGMTFSTDLGEYYVSY